MTKKKSKSSKLKIKPCGHYVLVKPERMDKISAGGIILQDKTVDAENVAKVRGEIVALGENAWKAFDDGDPWAKVGDKVYFKRHVSDMINDESDKDDDGEPQAYFLMQDSNILAVIEDQTMSEKEEVVEEVIEEPTIDLDALQASIDGDDEVVEEAAAEGEEVVEEVVEPEFDINAAINSGEHVNLSDKVTPEQAEAAAAERGWNEEGKDKYGHQISAIEFLERSSFFKKNDLMRGDIDKLNTKLDSVLKQNQQIAQKSIDDKKKLTEDFKAEKEKLLSGEFLDEDGLARVRELDSGIESNQVAAVEPQVDDIVADYETARDKFKTDNEWYGSNRALTALADKVGTEYAIQYEKENGRLPEPDTLFTYVLDEVKKDMPSQAEPARPTRVASANRVVTQTRKPKTKTLLDLPEDQRAVAALVIEATGQTEADYLKTYKFQRIRR